eukprot:SAG31_NODE_1295_length_8952_cov_8.332957_5_plen_162_part_00
MNVLTSRLIQYFQGGGDSSDFEIAYKDALPLPEYFSVIEQHLLSRHNQARIAKQLEDRATQFRAVQKRLLVRFKDRNPAPLSHLETLLAGTYQQLVRQQSCVQVLISSNCASTFMTLLHLLVGAFEEFTAGTSRITARLERSGLCYTADYESDSLSVQSGC